MTETISDTTDTTGHSTDTGSCRLCAGSLSSRFSLEVLRQHKVAYYACDCCHSLQTETPYWLHEAYAKNLASLDTGALQRNINNFVVCYAIARLFDVRTAVDYGGGDGLLCRFMRDHSFDCYTHDKFASPSYAQGFAAPPALRPDLLTAFEVLEHLAHPSTELQEIFSFAPKYLLVSTDLYTGQGPDWWYLAPDAGQHVFFYSPQAITMIAQRFGYSVAQAGAQLLFLRKDVPDAASKIVLAKEVLQGWIFQAIKSYVFLLPTPGVASDFDLVGKRR